MGIVTKPFAFEGKRKLNMAEIGISGLLDRVDSMSLIHILALETLLTDFYAAFDAQKTSGSV